MFVKKIDYLSPPVTFYFKGYLAHSSIVSGILSIISFVLIILLAVYFSLDLILRKNPKAFYYNIFTEDSGIFPLNASSFFHFLSLSYVNSDYSEDVGVDFTYFRIIGFNTYYEPNSITYNISNFDHWLYGKCNNNSDTSGINYLTTQSFFEKSACIRKYYNSDAKMYYDTNDPKFKWPVIAHGTYNPNKIFYCLIMEKCKEEKVDLILGKGNHCKSELQINSLLENGITAHFFFIDHYVDVSNYKKPII